MVRKIREVIECENNFTLFQDAQQAGKANEFQCQDLYLCPNSLVQLKRMYNQI